MQKKLNILVLLVIGLLTACDGDIGPQGPSGLDGLDGQDGADGLIGSVFEAEVTFTEADNFEFIVDIPASIDIVNTDVVIAYTLSGVDNGVDIWEPLPQTLFINNDILLYGYDYTVDNVRFFLDGTIDLTTLEATFTDNIVFRVAVIPADLATTINTNSMNEVMSALNIEGVKRLK